MRTALKFLFFFAISTTVAASPKSGGPKIGPPTPPDARAGEAGPSLVVVIDPGHGGKDPGAIGVTKVKEKEIALAIARKVSARLKGKAQVVLTRSRDQFVSLDGRDRLANRNACDLFVSIHANSSRRRSASGIELYTLNNATDEASRRLAQRENEGASKKEKEIEAIVSQLILNASAEDSADLAAQLKKSLNRTLKRYGTEVRVKSALFYVLVGAKCPSLLVESGFLTNRREAQRLRTPAYQDHLAQALADGIMAYFQSVAQPKGVL